MAFKVMYMHGNSLSWTASGTYSSEQVAISNAKNVSKRPTITNVKVVDDNQNAVWIG
jgi:hypothetical protein